MSCSRISEPWRRWLGRRAHVGAHGIANQAPGGSSRSGVASNGSTDGRTRSTIARRLRDCFSTGRFSCSIVASDRAATRVAEHDDEPRVELLGRELDAADLRRRDDVAGDADDEQIAEPLIEHDLGRHARVGAAEHDRERLLPLGELVAPRRADACRRAGDRPRSADCRPASSSSASRAEIIRTSRKRSARWARTLALPMPVGPRAARGATRPPAPRARPTRSRSGCPTTTPSRA